MITTYISRDLINRNGQESIFLAVCCDPAGRNFTPPNWLIINKFK
jgi:hypothetical protein